jgi:protein arginine N-methyltransferase 1
MYSLSDYGDMIADKTRMDPYAYALKDAIGPDSIVLDIGAATGIHALLAAKFGARQVYAIEPSDAIFLAREVARANGFEDCIKFIHDLSTNITLPKRADVIVSDLRGIMPLFGAHVPSIVDARQRHLAPGGVLIPQGDTLWVALVEAPITYKELIKPWDLPYGLDMEEAKQIVLNSWTDANTDLIRSRNLLMKPYKWAELDYTKIENPDVDGSILQLTAARDGTAHGLLVWFDARLAEGIGFSNGPEVSRAANVYGRGFFPLLEPVAVSQGDSITLAIQAELDGEEYIWHWHTLIHSRSESRSDPRKIKANFKQSTSFDGPWGFESIKKHISTYQPSLGKYGQVDLFILGQMNGRTPIDQIARQVQEKFPTHFDGAQDALRYVYDFSNNYN